MNFLGLIGVASYMGSLFVPHTLLKASDYIVKVFASVHISAVHQSVPDRSSSVALVVNKPINLRLIAMALPGETPSTPSVQQVKKLAASLSHWSHILTHQLKQPLITITRIPYTRVNHWSSSNALTTEFPQQCLPWHRKSSSHHQDSTRQAASQPWFQIQVNHHPVADVPTKTQATAIAQHFKEVLHHPQFNPSELYPVLVNQLPAGRAKNELLFTINPELETALHNKGERIAIHWVNNLRMALDTPTLSITDAQASLYGLTQTKEQIQGIASWYGSYFHGRRTAAGEIFDQTELTAAHPSLPFNTYLKVRNVKTGNTVIVRINDRGPYVGARSLDLSRAAARCLGSETTGVVPYEAVLMISQPALIGERNAGVNAASTPQRLARQPQEQLQF